MADILSGINLPQVLAHRTNISAVPQYQPNTTYLDQASKYQDLLNSRTVGDTYEQEKKVKIDTIENNILDDTSRMIANSPAEQRPYLYKDMIRRLEQVGSDTSIVPPEYSPEVDSLFTNRYETKFLLPERIKAAQEQNKLKTEYSLKAGLEDKKGANSRSVQELRNQGSLQSAQLGADASIYGADRSYQRGIDSANINATSKANSPILKAQAEAKAKLPKIMDNAQYTIGLIDDIIKHPALQRSVGRFDEWRPNITDSAGDFQLRIDQIDGEAFLQSIETLRGMGALSNEEGKRTVSAFSRLKTGQGEENFREAGREIQTLIKKGVKRAYDMANGKASPVKEESNTNKANNDPLGLL